MTSQYPVRITRTVALVTTLIISGISPALADAPITTVLDTQGVRKVNCSPHGWQYVYFNVAVPATASVSITGFRLTQADQWKPGDLALNEPWVRVLGPNGAVFDWASENATQDQYVLSLPFAVAGGSTFKVLSNYRHVAIVGTTYGSGDLQATAITDASDDCAPT
jgi:hypothetical protein